MDPENKEIFEFWSACLVLWKPNGMGPPQFDYTALREMGDLLRTDIFVYEFDKIVVLERMTSEYINSQIERKSRQK